VELLTGLKQKIKVSYFEKAFDEVINLLPDLCYDIPKAAEYTGYFLAQGVIFEFIQENFITPDKLKIPPSVAEGLLGQFFKNLLEKETKLLKRVYEPFSPNLADFVKDKNKERFLKQYDLFSLLGDEPKKATIIQPEPEFDKIEPETEETEPERELETQQQDPEIEQESTTIILTETLPDPPDVESPAIEPPVPELEPPGIEPPVQPFSPVEEKETHPHTPSRKPNPYKKKIKRRNL